MNRRGFIAGLMAGVAVAPFAGMIAAKAAEPVLAEYGVAAGDGLAVGGMIYTCMDPMTETWNDVIAAMEDFMPVNLEMRYGK